MWAFLLPISAVLTMAPVTGVLFLLYGLHMTYRSRFSPDEGLLSFLVGIAFFGSLLVASTTSLAWQAQRSDLGGLALALAVAGGTGSVVLGFLVEKRRLSDRVDGIPVVLKPLVDLQKHRLRSLPVERPAPAIGRIAFLAALVMNVPLVLQLHGFDGNSALWLVMPLLFAAVAYILATGVGPALARIQSLQEIERRTGRQFTTERLEELAEMRNGLWLARWLCRDEDFGVER
ncbi:hypothetical protein [Roseateles amylovorans]|uniref:Uncharacterized protein n=1 Tax=Roseateles amylovorans TaxID=2978473 RepID=A0ABY6B8A0_9BURK|nr:hypothetical protein [Roseateles amylovorans]UXH80166.1 hypothetical protein N4261_09915 [Roseateles amylovorans]